ncbi:hypothetical protein [Salinicoccus halitifaciens]|uniref:Uncharacterized protein n=1 Tax=Salinicoccus halitifaciens TaxID=1073415 RepID=A0ABV2EAT5_9STAP|nr:hypothetical protein [Salinicoccus halitifaciens]MCD2137621.1 hypothetical protein [Salinicoccus halitifaciens]
MTVKVIRKKERMTADWTELEVYLDEAKVTSIYGSDTAEVELEGETGELKVKQIMNKVVTKHVKQGDTVEVSNSRTMIWVGYLLPVLLLIMFTSSIFDLLNFWILSVLVVGYIIFISGIKPLQIKVISSSRESGN